MKKKKSNSPDTLNPNTHEVQKRSAIAVILKSTKTKPYTKTC